MAKSGVDWQLSAGPWAAWFAQGPEGPWAGGPGRGRGALYAPLLVGYHFDPYGSKWGKIFAIGENFN